MTEFRPITPPGLWQRRHRMLGYGFGVGVLLLWASDSTMLIANMPMLVSGLFYAGLVIVTHRTLAGVLLSGIALTLTGLWLTWPGGLVNPPTHPLTLLAMLQLSAIVLVYLWHFVLIAPRWLRALAFLIAGLLLLWWLAVLVHASAVMAGSALIAIGVGLALLEQGRWRWICQDHRRLARLSVIIICQDEADRIAACLERVAGWADEIVVVDSGSQDGTLEIVRRYTDNVWELDWHGYGRQKQLALDRCGGDWVLSIDADELVTAELRREIDAWLSKPCDFAGFRIAWVSEVFGKYVFFGADGRYHCRLFRRDGARFDEADVHEDVCLDGRIAPLGAPICHVTFRDYGHLKEKMTRYALISAERIARRRRVGPVGAWVRMLISFGVLYVRRLGALDGARGLLMATVYAIYTFDKYAAAWTRRAQHRPGKHGPDKHRSAQDPAPGPDK